MTTNKKWHERNVKQVVYLAVAALLVASALVWYVSTPEKGAFVTATFDTPAGEVVGPFKLEVSKSPASRERGLMFRKKSDLPENRGMLFVFPDDAKRTFWMKNTYVSLDIIFISRDGRVIGSVENADILSEKPLSVEGVSRYVVELNAGAVRKSGIVKGSTLKLKGATLSSVKAE